LPIFARHSFGRVLLWLSAESRSEAGPVERLLVVGYQQPAVRPVL
jgi:hypothetical protein